MAVTRAEIDWAYKVILGRIPESEGIYSRIIMNGGDLCSLMSDLAGSTEHVAKISRTDEPMYGYDNNIAAQMGTLAVLGKIAPNKVRGFQKIRLGRDYDGGYVMLDDLLNIDCAYSLGINEDVSWDLDIAYRGIDVYQYDHTISHLPVTYPLFHWAPVGIEAISSDNPNLDTLERLINKNGHTAYDNMLLKCDIEGHEWAMFAEMSPGTLCRFRQIVVELHFLNDLAKPVFRDLVRRAISNLTINHRVIHVHGNNHASYSLVGGIPIPAVLELTLIRMDNKLLEPSDERFPTPLDMPCDPLKADYVLGSFRFQ